jgi:hypothetical protein
MKKRPSWSIDLCRIWVDGVEEERRVMVTGRFLFRVVSRVGGGVAIVDFDGVIAAGVDGRGHEEEVEILFRAVGADVGWGRWAESRGVSLSCEAYRKDGGVETLRSDRAVSQRDDDVWENVDIDVLGRRLLRVVSDASPDKRHRRGRGEDFDLVVGIDTVVWLREDSSDAFLRKEVDGGVSVAILPSGDLIY